MAFRQNPGALFIGTLSPDDKAFVASVLKAALDDGYEKVVEPCSGGLAMSCIAADVGFQSIEASDITLFSGILGRYVEGRGIEDMEITRIEDGSRIEDPLDAMMEIKHAELVGKAGSVYGEAMLIDFEQRYDEIRAGVQRRMDEIRERIPSLKYRDMDMFDHINAVRGEKRGTLEQLPYCVLTDRGVEIVSGHHRTRAARAAGLDHINVLLDRTELTRSSIAAKQLAHNAIEGTDDEDMLRHIADIITDVDDMLESAIDKEYFDAVQENARQMPVPQVDFDWKTVQLTFLDHQVCDLNRLCEKAAKADVELAVPMELFEPFVEALQATKKYGDVKNAGAAVWLMTRAALRQFGEDDSRAYTPIMKLFGRAAIPTTTYEGVKSIIERKMKAGEISQPWEIFENLLGEKTYGARGRKAD